MILIIGIKIKQQIKMYKTETNGYFAFREAIIIFTGNIKESP